MGEAKKLADSCSNTQHINHLRKHLYNLFGKSLYNANTESFITKENHLIHIPQKLPRT